MRTVDGAKEHSVSKPGTPARQKQRRRAAPVLAAALCMLLLCASLNAAADDKRADELFETALGAYGLKRYEDAATKFYDFMAAAPYDPRNDQAQYYVGRSCMHRNYLNKAIEEFGYLIEDFPDSIYATLAHYYTAECYLKTRKEDKALEHYEQVVLGKVKHHWHWSKNAMEKQRGDNHRNAVFWLAKHYLAKKEHEKAIAAYQKLPHEMEAFRYVVNVYYGLQDYDKIKELIDGLQDTNRHEAFKYMVEFYAKKKAFNQLKSIFSKLLEEKNPNNATDDLVRTTAENFRHIGWEHWDWAMGMVSKHYPRAARWADYRLANRHWNNMQYQDQMELFVIKYRTGNDVDWVLRHKGVALEQHNKPDEARKDYKRIGNTAQGHWYIAESYHGRYCKKKEPDEAIKEYVKLRTAFYSMEWAAMAQWRVGELYRQKKDVDKAVEAFRHVTKRFASVKIEEGHWRHVLAHNLGRNKTWFGPDGQLALGDVLREAKRWDDAIMEYKTLVRKYPKTEQASWSAYRTALCYEGKDEPDTAIAVMKSVLRRYGKTAAASDAHTRLETKYNVADTEVSDDVDFFDDKDIEPDKRDFIDDPGKLKRR